MKYFWIWQFLKTHKNATSCAAFWGAAVAAVSLRPPGAVLPGASGDFVHQNPITGASGDSLRQNPINVGGLRRESLGRVEHWPQVWTWRFVGVNLSICGCPSEQAAATFLKVRGSYSSRTTLQGQAWPSQYLLGTSLSTTKTANEGRHEEMYWKKQFTSFENDAIKKNLNHDWQIFKTCSLCLMYLLPGTAVNK